MQISDEKRYKSVDKNDLDYVVASKDDLHSTCELEKSSLNQIL
jgi:hypothetical protein